MTAQITQLLVGSGLVFIGGIFVGIGLARMWYHV